MSRSTTALTALTIAAAPLAGLVAAPVTAAPAAATTVPITRVSVASDGTQANARTTSVAISGDGRVVAFASDASNLVAGDTNNASDVFVRDTTTDTTERVSVATGGGQLAGTSFEPAISRTGRYVAFVTDANLGAHDTNGSDDVYVHDRKTGTTTLVSVGTNGQAAGNSEQPNISADGTKITFVSVATNILHNPPTNKNSALYRRNLTTSKVVQVAPTIGCSPDQTETCGIDGYAMDDAANSFAIEMFTSFATSPDSDHSDTYTLASLAATPVHRTTFDNEGASAGVSPSFAVSGDGHTVLYREFVNFSSFDIAIERDGGAGSPIPVAVDGDVSATNHQGTNVLLPTLVKGDNTDPLAVLCDLVTQRCKNLSPAADGGFPDAGLATRAAFPVAAESSTGAVVAFVSLGTNHVVGDTNGVADAFVIERSAVPNLPAH